jgi:hypothetical protein
MFETDPNIALSGIAFRNKINADHNRRIAESNARIAAGWERTALEVAEQRDKALAELADAKARIAELELQVKLAQATDEADQKLLAEWRTLHPQSPLRQAVGKLKDGRPLTKGFAIWAAEFDRVAKKLGITNPEAYRIS